MIQARTEERPFTPGAYTSRMGRSTVDIECPFCRALIIVYVWSFHGHGKKACSCGAMLHRDGMARKLVEQQECPTCLGNKRIRDAETNDLRRCLDCGGSGVR